MPSPNSANRIHSGSIAIEAPSCKIDSRASSRTSALGPARSFAYSTVNPEDRADSRNRSTTSLAVTSANADGAQTVAATRMAASFLFNCASLASPTSDGLADPDIELGGNKFRRSYRMLAKLARSAISRAQPTLFGWMRGEAPLFDAGRKRFARRQILHRKQLRRRLIRLVSSSRRRLTKNLERALGTTSLAAISAGQLSGMRRFHTAKTC